MLLLQALTMLLEPGGRARARRESETPETLEWCRDKGPKLTCTHASTHINSHTPTSGMVSRQEARSALVRGKLPNKLSLIYSLTLTHSQLKLAVWLSLNYSRTGARGAGARHPCQRNNPGAACRGQHRPSSIGSEDQPACVCVECLFF